MAENNIELAAELDSKVTLLLARYKAARDRIQTLETDNQRLQAQLSEATQAQAQLSQQFDTYRAAHAIVNGTTDSNEAKRRITQIVREIDKCIALLNR